MLPGFATGTVDRLDARGTGNEKSPGAVPAELEEGGVAGRPERSTTSGDTAPAGASGPERRLEARDWAIAANSASSSLLVSFSEGSEGLTGRHFFDGEGAWAPAEAADFCPPRVGEPRGPEKALDFFRAGAPWAPVVRARGRFPRAAGPWDPVVLARG